MAAFGWPGVNSLRPWRNRSTKPFLETSSLNSFAIIIPSHSRADLLFKCLASLRRHAPLDTEILVVDDASANGMISRVAEKFPGVRVHRNETRQGFCKSVNLAAQLVQASIIQILNDDTEVCPGWAESALDAFDDEKVAAVAPLVLRWPGAVAGQGVVDSAGDAYFLSGVATKRANGTELMEANLNSCKVFGASGSSAFYRRDVFLMVGGYPEYFGAYFEDVDLSFRLHWAGYWVRFEPTSRVLHHVGSSYGRVTLPRALLQSQALNEERVFWRNLPLALLVKSLPTHFMALLAKAFKRGAEGNLLPFLLGKMRMFLEIPQVFLHRLALKNKYPQTNPTAQEWCLEGLTGMRGFLVKQLFGLQSHKSA